MEDNDIKCNAKFSMYADYHPCQWTLVQDILKNDLQVTWKTSNGPNGMIIFYITGYIKKEFVTDEDGNKFHIVETGNDIKVTLEERKNLQVLQVLPEEVVSVEDVGDNMV